MIKNPILLTDSYSLSHEFLKINKDFEVAHFYNRTGATIFNGLSDILTKQRKNTIIIRGGKVIR